ncbi:vitamin K epoxide reductase family protein [Candidatus Woesearchaeota archaeon]|nr:vitamin K epoxide reductase family protein [Candidatus Woesearchaeota archaeon]
MAKKRSKQRSSAGRKLLATTVRERRGEPQDVEPPIAFVPSFALEEKRIARNLRTILFLSIIGMIAATYLTYNHYKPDAESFCSLSKTINCDIVNKSPYAEIFGVPVAILGFLAYLSLVACCLLLLRCANLEKLHRKLTSRHVHWMIFFIAITSFGFSTWLTYVEWKILMTWCLLCVLSYLLLTLILLLSIANIEYDYRCLKKRNTGPRGARLIKKTGKVCEFC